MTSQYKEYVSPNVGNNISWILWGVPKRFYKDSNSLEKLLKDGLKKDGLSPLDCSVHYFGEDAYTMLMPLSESHLSVHTYKEHDCMVFGLYSCLDQNSGMKTYQTTLDKIKPEHHVLFRNDMPLIPSEINNARYSYSIINAYNDREHYKIPPKKK